MPNMVKIKKLDGRMNGHGFWTHRTEPSMLTKRDAIMNFVEFRKYLTEMFGPGVHEKEVGTVKHVTGEAPLWGWDDWCSVYGRDVAATVIVTSAERFTKRYER